MKVTMARITAKQKSARMLPGEISMHRSLMRKKYGR